MELGSGFGGGAGTQTIFSEASTRTTCWRYTTVFVKSTVVSTVVAGNGTRLPGVSSTSVAPGGVASSAEPDWRGTLNTATAGWGSDSRVRAISALSVSPHFTTSYCATLSGPESVVRPKTPFGVR